MSNPLSTQHRGKVLAIRCSTLDGLNPIVELNNVIKERKYGWFGKYGSPINTFRATNGKFPHVLLVGNGKFVGDRECFYKALDCSATMPEERAAFPSYYGPVISRIGTWFKLARVSGYEINVADYSILSSRQPLKTALANSMRGHFWCIGPVP